jgi:two-component sensor histidine kinase
MQLKIQRVINPAGRYKMTLRKKTLIIISATIIGLIIVLFATSHSILLASFADLEEQNTHRNAERIHDALLYDIDNLKRYCYDWSSWDDTYEFIDDKNEEYIESNLVDNTFPRLQINLLMYFNSTGDMVIAKAYDLQNEEEMPLPEGLLEYLSTNEMLTTHRYVTSKIGGIILLPEGPMLIASTPIITSEAEGPINGTVIMGRFLNSAVIENLASITHLSLTMHQLDDPNMLPDIQEAKSLLSDEEPILVRPLNDTSIAGYVLFNDVHGEPVLILRTNMPRGIHEQGQKTVNYIFLSLLLTGLIFGSVSILFLEKSILSRVSNLSRSVANIGEEKNLSTRMPVTGNDELSFLANSINVMLEKLEDAEDLKKKELLLKEIHHRVKNNLQVISSLLNLQSQRIKDEKVVQMLHDSQNRIKSMALIHEKLYKSKDLAGIDFNEYLSDLIMNLFRTYRINSDKVKLKMNVMNISLGLDSAIPCGLIINELVSNSFKYAFSEGENGEICVEIHPADDGKFILTVSDSGVGFPEELDFRSSETLGLQLVTSLVEQLNGTIELDRSDGTKFTITFKELKP